MQTFSPGNGVIKPKPVPAVDRVHTFSPENGVIKPKPVPAVGRSARVKSREWVIKPKPVPAVERVHAFSPENRLSSMWSKRVKEGVIADDSETHYHALLC